MKNFIRSFVSHFLNFAYPRVCVACQTCISDTGTDICFDCQWALPRNTNLLIHNESPENKFWGRVKTHGIYSFLSFTKGGSVQNILHALKYKNHPDLALFLGQLCGKAIGDYRLFPEAECLIPIPLHPTRQRERGYNQAERIAAGIGEICGIPVQTGLLIRNKSTRTQTRTGGRLSRYQNLQGVFGLSSGADVFLKGKRVILVDDVLTTGATLEVAATVLWEAGIKELYVVTLAAVKRN